MVVEKMTHYNELSYDKLKDEILKITGSYGELAIKILNEYGLEMACRPAATKHHCNYWGGLAEHTANVMSLGAKIAKEVFDEEHFVNQIRFIGLIHDLGKVKVYNPLGGMKKQPSYTNTKSGNRLVGHESMSIYLMGIVLGKNPLITDDMLVGILAHEGGWGKVPPNLYGSILHAADLVSSRMEKVKDW
jgi:hypothetical protein